MSDLNTALPPAQHSSTNLGFVAWSPKECIPVASDVRSVTTPSPTPTSSKPSSEFVRPSCESRWSDLSTNYPYQNTRSTRRTATSTEFFEEDEDEGDDLEFYPPHGSPRRSYHSTYGGARSSLSLGITQVLYLSSTTAGPPPPVPPFPPEFLTERLPRKYTPSASPIVGEFDPNADDERYFVTRSKRSVAASLKKQLKRMFRKRSGSVARVL